MDYMHKKHCKNFYRFFLNKFNSLYIKKKNIEFSDKLKNIKIDKHITRNIY